MASNFVRRSLLEPDHLEGGVEKMKVEFVTLGGIVFRRLKFDPGFRASVHLKQAMGMELCPFPHTLVITSGKGTFKMTDGQEYDVESGDVLEMDGDHDFWTTSDDPCVMIEPTFESAEQ